MLLPGSRRLGNRISHRLRGAQSARQPTHPVGGCFAYGQLAQLVHETDVNLERDI